MSPTEASTACDTLKGLSYTSIKDLLSIVNYQQASIVSI